MYRLTDWRSLSSTTHWEKPIAPANLGAYAKRNIKTSFPVSATFGRGYGLVPNKPLSLNLLVPDRAVVSIPLRGMAVGKPKTKSEASIEEENLKPKNMKLRPSKETLDDITEDLVSLSEKEIQAILDGDANSIQTERGKTWLEQSQYTLRPHPEQKDTLVLAKQLGNTQITVTFKKEYEEEQEEEGEAAEEGREEGVVAETEEEVAKEEDAEGAESWIRSGDELPDREDFPQKHSLEIDIRIQGKDAKLKGKLHLYAFAGLDDRLYINEMLCENDVTGTETPADKKTYCVFDDLSDPMQDRIYDYLDELGVDDRMAHFVKTTVAREKKESDIAFLTNFKEILKG